MEHTDHRKRMRERFLSEGLDNFAEHEALELLLYYSIARKDVNPLAHQLVNRFGSLAAVFDASYNELLKVPGVGENTAVLIKLLTQLARKYHVSANSNFDIVNTIEDAARLLGPRFVGKNDEELWMLCLDGKGKVLGMRMLACGSMNLSTVNIRRLMEAALATECSCAVLAHNHPSGIAVPSTEDEDATNCFRSALQTVGVMLVDHLIFAKGENDYVSMKESGLLGG
ncbi:MAG: DNA repair protein RadC [Ruminococcaceae bacterium]|nr:DNA repair protein RadC [Oscillospiraceae bacterium]